jgi:hypothetical protein
MALPVIDTTKPSDSPVYSGVPAPDPSAAGITSTGGWANTNIPFYGYTLNVEVLQGIPAPIMPTLPAASNPTVTKVSPNSFKVTLSLSGTSTVQLAPGFNNAQNNSVSAVAPNSFNGFVYTSRNQKIATVSSSGLVTAVTRGECTVLIGSARQANEPFAGASPPAGTTGCEVYCELNVIVVA